MRALVLNIFIVTLLFASLEGAAESVSEPDFHQTHHAHADTADSQWFPDSDCGEHDGESCEHFCHAHVVALSTQISLPNVPKLRNSVTSRFARTTSRGAAPPIPPPNI